jgi:hypothetical protein
MHVANSDNFQSSFSIAFWIKLDEFSLNEQEEYGILSQNSNSTQDELLHIIVRNGKFHAGLNCPCDGNNCTQGNIEIKPMNWYHFSFCFDAVVGRQTIYINGKLDSFTDGHISLKYSNPLYISKYLENSKIFTGRYKF